MGNDRQQPGAGRGVVAGVAGQLDDSAQLSRHVSQAQRPAAVRIIQLAQRRHMSRDSFSCPAAPGPARKGARQAAEPALRKPQQFRQPRLAVSRRPRPARQDVLAGAGPRKPRRQRPRSSQPRRRG